MNTTVIIGEIQNCSLEHFSLICVIECLVCVWCVCVRFAWDTIVMKAGPTLGESHWCRTGLTVSGACWQNQ